MRRQGNKSERVIGDTRRRGVDWEQKMTTAIETSIVEELVWEILQEPVDVLATVEEKLTGKLDSGVVLTNCTRRSQ